MNATRIQNGVHQRWDAERDEWVDMFPDERQKYEGPPQTPSTAGTDVPDLPALHTALNSWHRVLDDAGVTPEGDFGDRLRKMASAYKDAVGGDKQDGTQVPEDVFTRQQEVEAAVEEITSWWRNEAEHMIAKTAPKAVEYGAHDLEIMGVGLASLVHAQLSQATPEERSQFGQYAAVGFYLMGKVARMMSALEQGTLPKEDTEFDIAVYAFMAMRIRQTGRWV